MTQPDVGHPQFRLREFAADLPPGGGRLLAEFPSFLVLPLARSISLFRHLSSPRLNLILRRLRHGTDTGICGIPSLLRTRPAAYLAGASSRRDSLGFFGLAGDLAAKNVEHKPKGKNIRGVAPPDGAGQAEFPCG